MVKGQRFLLLGFLSLKVRNLNYYNFCGFISVVGNVVVDDDGFICNCCGLMGFERIAFINFLKRRRRT